MTPIAYIRTDHAVGPTADTDLSSWADTDVSYVHDTAPCEFEAWSELSRGADSDLHLKAALARAGMAVHPNDPVRPADLAPHRTPTGDPVHELGWTVAVLVSSIGCAVMLASLVAGWL